MSKQISARVDDAVHTRFMQIGHENGKFTGREIIEHMIATYKNASETDTTGLKESLNQLYDENVNLNTLLTLRQQEIETAQAELEQYQNQPPPPAPDENTLIVKLAPEVLHMLKEDVDFVKTKTGKAYTPAQLIVLPYWQYVTEGVGDQLLQIRTRTQINRIKAMYTKPASDE